MDIKLKYMAEDDTALAEHLAPPEILAKLKLPKHIGLLAIDVEDMTPCGVALASHGRGNRLDIEWVSVYEDYRDMGVGSELIYGCYEAAKDLKLPTLGFLMEGELATLENVEAIREYIEEFGFFTGVFINGDWNVTPKDYDNSLLGKKRIKSNHVIPAEELSRDEIRNYLRSNWDRLKNYPMYDYEKVLASYSDIFSMVYKVGRNIEGVLLVQFAGRVIYPLVLDDGGEKRMAMELLNGLRKAVAEEEDRYFAHVLSSEHGNQLMKEFFRNTHALPAYLWISDTSFYDKYLLTGKEPPEQDILAVNAPVNYTLLRTDRYGDV